MPVAEFEEKEYEVAAAIELATDARRYGHVFSSGQVLEKIVGYDAAADPWSGHRIWVILGVPRPAGVRLLPQFWHPGAEPSIERLPCHPVSFILQYKRPTYLRGASSKQWARWRRPYYRFERTAEQQRILRRLEQAVDGSVVVRYASPAFWQRGDLERNQFMRTVLQSSGFVAPSILGSHRVWTYERPGTIGYPNPSGRGRIFQTIDELLAREIGAAQGQELVQIDAFDDHLSELASLALRHEPRLARAISIWVAALEATGLNLADQTTRRLANFASVQSVLGRVGASWHMRESTI
jgi:hypothetical protein